MPLPPSCRVKFCLGFPLQKGCIILGFSGMLWSMLEIGKHLRWLVDFELSVKQCRRKENFNVPTTELEAPDASIIPAVPHDSDDVARNFITLENRDNGDRDKCPSDHLVSLVRFVHGFASFKFAIYFLMTMMMIHGVMKKRPNMMSPWLVWVVAQLFFDLLSLLGLGRGTTPLSFWAILDVIINVYFILFVTSYYLELKEAEEGRLGVTVVAVTQTPNEMMVIIPTGPKDDPPPPYPGFTSVYNPAYNPTGTGLPMTSTAHSVAMSPPEYQPRNFMQVNHASHVPIPGSPPLYSDLTTCTPNFPDGASEAAPLVGKPSLPNN